MSDLEKDPCNFPPIYPTKSHTVAPPAAGTLDRGWYYRPKVVPGYVAVLDRLTMVSQNATTGVYAAAIAPRWLATFISPNRDDLPTANGEFTPPAALANPLEVDMLFFAAAGTTGLVQLTNGGNGFEFPFHSYQYHWPLFFSAERIGTNTNVAITPVIVYRKRGER